jgi:hypothetical protein
MKNTDSNFDICHMSRYMKEKGMSSIPMLIIEASTNFFFSFYEMKIQNKYTFRDKER